MLTQSNWEITGGLSVRAGLGAHHPDQLYLQLVHDVLNMLLVQQLQLHQHVRPQASEPTETGDVIQETGRDM